MLSARLEYLFSPDKTYVYLRTMEMTSQEGEQAGPEGRVVTEQTWQIVEEHDDFAVAEIRERVLEKKGPLSEQFQPPAPTRKAYLDGCGLLPKSGREYPTLSAFPGFLEEPVEPGDAWENPEFFPNWPVPVDVRYTLEGFAEKQELIAVLSSRGQAEQEENSIQAQGQFRFAVGRGVLLSSRLVLENKLPGRAALQMIVTTELQA